jgi:hypothetical protein
MVAGDRDREVAVYPSIVDSLFLSGASLTFVSVGIGSAVYAYLDGAPRAQVIAACAAAAFFGLCFLFAIPRWRRRPLLVLDARGLVDNSTIAGAGHISWREVRSIHVLDAYGQRYLAVDLVNPEAFVWRQRPLKRAVYRLNKRLLKTDVAIPQIVLPVPATQLLQLCRSHRRAIDKPSDVH